MSNTTASSWLEIDITGFRRTLERKGKAWAIFELVQNAWDTEATLVEVTLTKPKNVDGQLISTLICKDNDPDGYRNLDEAHTLFASSSKKADPTKRGRFNAGEKQVLAMCESAKVSSTTGQVVFAANGKRKETDEVRTEVGTIFEGKIEMSEEEWAVIGKQVQLLIPPIKTVYNGVEISGRIPLRAFQEQLPTEIANERGVLTPRKRTTEVRAYRPQQGETPYLYERGIPVVTIDGKYHVSVEQKVPLNMDRDNVTPHYLKTIHTVILNNLHDDLTEEEASSTWVVTAVGNTERIKPEAAAAYVEKAFGKKAAIKDYRDAGSIKETESRGWNNIPPNALTPEVRATIDKHDLLKKTSQICPTEAPTKAPARILSPDEYDEDQRKFVRLITTVAPTLIEHEVTVQIIDDADVLFLGCFLKNVASHTTKGRANFKAGSFLFQINVAHHDTSDWEENYSLLIHELAHHHPLCQNNDHLKCEFYETVNSIGAKLAMLALTKPEIFPAELLEELAA
jgi:hypothetical protein